MSRPSHDAPILFAHATPEFLLAAACCFPDARRREVRLNQLLTSTIDWTAFLAQVERHRIPGLAHRALGSHPAVPASTRTALARAAQTNAFANLRSVAILSRIADAFRAASVPFAVLKGLPLSQLVYRDAALRHSRDIDLLVAASDTFRAEAALLQLGLHRSSPQAAVTARQQKQWLRVRKHFEYGQDGSPIAVELHWRTQHNRLLSSGAEHLHHTETITLPGGVVVPVLPQSDLLANLCTHGAGHAWFRLKWLADVAALLALDASSDRSALLQRARSIERPLQQAFLLCDALLETPSTGFVPSRTSRWLAEVAAAALQQPIPSGTREFAPRRLVRSLFALQPGVRYKLEELRVHLASPADWQAFPLPRWAHFSYPLLRVPFWIKRRYGSTRL